MKQPLLFFLFIFLSFSVYTQVQGPPPPCGYFPSYACDTNDDGFAIFNLVEDLPFSTFCLSVGEDSKNYSTITYYASSIDRSNETNPIINPEAYVNTVAGMQSIYYRVNAINSSANYESLSGESYLEISVLFAKPLVIEVYDDDSDGLTEFDLTSISLFCGSSVESDYSVSFHETQSDATNNINTILNLSNFQNSFNPETVFVRTEHLTTAEIETASIELKALFAVANSISEVNICDDDGLQDGNYTLDLSEYDAEILGDQNSGNYAISYFSTQDDADNNTNQLASIYNVSNSETIYARVDENNAGTYATTSFQISIIAPPSINQPTSLEVCDGDDSLDGYTVIDLTVKDDEITSGNANLNVTYHYNQTDASNGINPISSPYININTPTDVVYVRVVDLITGCINTSTLDVNITIVPIINSDTQYINACDSDFDGYATFDLTHVIPDVLQGLEGVTVTFHESSDDAQIGVNAIANETNYQNLIPNEQTLFVRVEDNITGCASEGALEIHTNLLLTGINSGDFALCDINDDINDTMDFNLNTVENFISNNLPSPVTVTFFESESDRDSNIGAIDKTQVYEVLSSTTLYIRIDDGNCSEVSDITLLVNSILLFTPVAPISYCDTDGDGIASIDLYSLDDLITNGNTNFQVTYFPTEFDANNNNTSNKLPQFYTNTNSIETIYARIENVLSGCATINSFELEVKDCSDLGIIEINAFYDADSNTSFDNDEINFLNGTLTYEKNNDGIQRKLYSSNGFFNILSDDVNNTFDISYNVLSEYDSCYDITTTSFENVQVDIGNIVNYNFPITKVQDCGDIALYLVSYAPPRPGFDYYNRLVIINKGLETVTSGSVEFTHDPIVTLNNVFGVTIGNSVTNTATGFTLDFINLEPNQSESIVVSMNVPIPTPLGTLLTNIATYSVTDLSVENNTSTLAEIVIGSYDPNDIAESHGPEILHSSFETTDYLYYTVRFQNVGTADAINVSIDNTLDSRLDKSTIQMLSASHDNVFTRTDNQLNWQFDDIHLPSEDMDEPNSHGYVYYKIKPLAGYSVGDIVPNTAEIYFDFNPAVITNTFNTEFITTLSNPKLNIEELSIFPNPTSDVVKLKFNKRLSKSIQMDIYNIQGKKIINEFKDLNADFIELNVRQLSKGVYFLKVNTGESEIIKKLIIN